MAEDNKQPVPNKNMKDNKGPRVSPDQSSQKKDQHTDRKIENDKMGRDQHR